jgi:hypothetical protein
MKKEYNIDLHVRIPISLDQEIISYCSKLRKRNKAEGIKELLKIALFTVENWTLIKKNPNQAEELHKQLREGELVDSIQALDQREFELMFDIFKNEHKSRYGSKSNNLISSIDNSTNSRGGL